MPYTTSGIRITVDASDIQTKFTKSVEQLNAGLSKTQKQLHLFYNEQGLLTNALGQNVEGLSANEIRLGQYVDELGRARTFQGGLTQGLNKSQLAMGFYADELGNIYNKTGALVIPTKKLGDALAETAKKTTLATEAAAINANEMQAKFAAAGGKLSAAIGTVNTLSASLTMCAGATGAFGGALSATGVAMSQAVMLFGAYQQILAFTSSIKKASEAVGVFNATLTALGGPLGVALLITGAIVALGTAIANIKNEKITKLSADFKELAKEAKAAGENVRDMGALIDFKVFGAGGASSISELKKQLRDLTPELERLEEKSRRSLFGLGGEELRQLLDLRNQYKNTVAQINTSKRDTVASAVKEYKVGLIDTYNQLRDVRNLYKEATAAGSKATQVEKDALRQKLEDLTKLYNEQLRAEKDRKLYNGALARIDDYTKSLNTQNVDLQAFAKFSAGLTRALNDGETTFLQAIQVFGGVLNENAARLAKTLNIDPNALIDVQAIHAASRATRDAFNGFEQAYKDGALTAAQLVESVAPLELAAQRDKLNEGLFKAEQAFKAGAISASQYAQLIEKSKDSLEQLTLQEIAQKDGLIAQLRALGDAYARGALSQDAYNTELEKKRAQLAQELGVAIPEQSALVTNFTDVAEKIAKARDAYQNNALTLEQFNNVVAQLQGVASAHLQPLADLEKWVANDPGMTAEARYAETLDGIAEQKKKSQADFKKAETLQVAAEKELQAAQIARANALTEVAQYELAGRMSQKDAAARREQIEKQFEQAQTTYKNTLQSAADLQASATKTQESLQAQRDKAESQYLRDLDRAAAAGDAVALAQINYADQLEQITALEKSGVYSKQKADQMRQAAEAQRLDVITAETAKRKQDLRQSLGVDNLMQSLKSPFELFSDKMHTIADAIETGAVTMYEARALVEQTANDYKTKLREAAQKARDAQIKEYAQFGAGVASGGDAGSSALYAAILRTNGVNYQDAIKRTTADILATSQEGLEYQRATAYATQTIGAAIANAGNGEVWG